jgi:hypothetical protein
LQLALASALTRTDHLNSERRNGTNQHFRIAIGNLRAFHKSVLTKRSEISVLTGG